MDTSICTANGHHKPQILPQGPATLPEAPCSITLRVPMPGYADHALITGRGQTGAEAAAQWQASRDALLAVLAPPPAPSHAQQVATLLACGLAKATAQGDGGLVERLSRAAALVLSGAVEPTDSPAVMAVRSATNREVWYEVTGKVCTCKDWESAARAGASRPCKHVLSVELAKRVGTNNVQ